MKLMELPELEALLLADHVYRDEVSKKAVIAGTFNTINAREFPTQFSALTSVYIGLKGLRGDAKLIVRFVDLQNQNVLIESSPVPISVAGPLQSHEVVMQLPPLPIPHAGVYAMEVYVNDTPIGSRRIFANAAN